MNSKEKRDKERSFHFISENKNKIDANKTLSFQSICGGEEVVVLRSVGLKPD